MPRRPLGLLSLGVFAVIVAICLIAYAAGYIIVDAIFPLIVAFFGVWVMVVAGIKTKSQEKYERGAFSTFAWGILIAAVGGLWFLNVQGLPLIYTLAFLMLVIGFLAVVSALRLWRK
ncbi:MAG: hypothetical protein ACE5J6_01650 [Candidatus Bathyarchaeia archaeon]